MKHCRYFCIFFYPPFFPYVFDFGPCCYLTKLLSSCLYKYARYNFIFIFKPLKKAHLNVWVTQLFFKFFIKEFSPIISWFSLWPQSTHSEIEAGKGLAATLETREIGNFKNHFVRKRNSFKISRESLRIQAQEFPTLGITSDVLHLPPHELYLDPLYSLHLLSGSCLTFLSYCPF